MGGRWEVRGSGREVGGREVGGVSIVETAMETL